MLIVVAVLMSVGAVATLALGTASLLNLGPFAETESEETLQVADRLGDCREAGLDTGEHCDRGADIETIGLELTDDSTLTVVLHLTDAPALEPAVAWTAEFYADVANAHTAGGVICGLSNVAPGAGDDQPGASQATSFALDPNTIPRQALPTGACNGRLGGSSARFTIDVTGQPDTDAIRLIGLVRVEHPGDPDRLGTEDDFLVRTSLADLRN